MSYDIIGDIHGHADELRHLLSKLGYMETQKDANSFFSHPEGRMAIFVGDLIDRGPKIRETLQIVKAMVDAGTALCTRGNHEDNAISFWRKNESGDYERKHSIKNIVQHFATIKAFQNREDEWKTYLKWFETLPYYLDLPGFRVVHACWPSELTKLISETPELNADPFLEPSVKSKILRGEEMAMPPGVNYADKDGNVRTASRTQWWLDPNELTYRQYFEAYVHDLPNLDVKIPEPVLATLGRGYPPGKPVFFGHYWLRGRPIAQTENVCCLDYSIAKGGSLVAYRFDGEKVLDNQTFVLVP